MPQLLLTFVFSHNEPALCPGDIPVQNMDVNTKKYRRASL